MCCVQELSQAAERVNLGQALDSETRRNEGESVKKKLKESEVARSSPSHMSKLKYLH